MGERALDAHDKFTFIVSDVVFRRRHASSISATSVECISHRRGAAKRRLGWKQVHESSERA